MAKKPKTKLIMEPSAHPKNFKMKSSILAREEQLGRRRRVPIETVNTKVSKVIRTSKPINKVHGNTGRRHSEETKRKMSLAQKKRWARVRKVLKRSKK